MAIKSLIINPGSTSTKIGVFEDENLLFEETLRHSTEEIAQYASIIDQKDFRKNIILDFLKAKDFDVKSFDMIVGRGGLLKPIPGGTYTVSDELLADLKKGVQGQHASNLGGILAREIGDEIDRIFFLAAFFFGFRRQSRFPAGRCDTDQKAAPAPRNRHRPEIFPVMEIFFRYINRQATEIA